MGAIRLGEPQKNEVKPWENCSMAWTIKAANTEQPRKTWIFLTQYVPYPRDNKRLFENKHGSKIFENKHSQNIEILFIRYKHIIVDIKA